MIPVGSVVSMAVLFRAVKQHRAMMEGTEQRQAASMAAGQANMAQEQASREQNLQRMREQTKAQLGMSVGMNPMMMGGDSSTAAYISQSAQRQMSPEGGRMLLTGKKVDLGLGMV